MAYLIGGYIIFILGFIIGAVMNPEETCPKAVKGYRCAGEDCDHRKTTLYQAHLDMAQVAADQEKETNLWGGPPHA